MSEGAAAAIAMISFFSSICFLGYLFFTTRNSERLALIDRGVDAGIFVSRSKGISITLRLAFLAMGVGAGVLLGGLLGQVVQEEISMPAMIFFCGGLGLFLAYLADEKKIRQDQERVLAHEDKRGSL